MVLALFMSAAPLLSTSTRAPTGAEVARLSLSDLLLLIIVQLLILWSESVVVSLRERTETTDLSEITRAFGTTDTALILKRVTVGLRRLHALEAKILGRAADLDTDTQISPKAAAATRRSPAALQSPGLNPAAGLLTPEPTAAPLVRATGPPRLPAQSAKPQRGLSILSHREAWQAPSCRFSGL